MIEVELEQAIDTLDKIRLSKGFKSVWSIFEVTNKMNEVAFKNSAPMTVVYKDHWGPQPVSVTVSKQPTWMDLWLAADQLIRASGDGHHIFIERFIRDGHVLKLQTGS